ncbi:MAG: DNA polymerase III subunit gamma/tau [Thermoanaerobacteraceae bacterium]|nr:DNA polymerase III subunit gamma/tau [Thermoanaerobacteraceae bacterium]
MYQSLYRRYRPQSFDEVMGQDHIVRTLKNQIKMERVGHAYLFCGTRGTGKTSIAKIFAKAVNCPNNTKGEPCNNCEICKLIDSNGIMDIIEIDAASNNSVDDVRELRNTIIYAPSIAKYKVYIIDEVHMLSTSAFNALLKTLEEPPSHAIFILATTEPNKIPVTILSRCQRFDFKRIPEKIIAKNLKRICESSNIKIEDRAITAIAQYGNGSMRDAISILEQCASYSDDILKYEDVCDILGAVNDDTIYAFISSIYEKNASKAMKYIDNLMLYGIDISNMLKSITSFLRDVLLYKTCGDNAETILDEELKGVKQKAASFELEYLTNVLDKFMSLQGEIRYAVSPRILFEVTILKLINPEISTDLSGILNRLKNVEKEIEKIKNINDYSEMSCTKSEKKETDLIKHNKKMEEKAKIISAENIKEKVAENNLVSKDIKKIWNDAINIVKRDRPLLFSFMNYGIPYLKDDEIVVKYSHKDKVYIDELSKIENKDYIKDVLCKITGMELKLKFAVKKSEEEELIEQVKNYFGDIEIKE